MISCDEKTRHLVAGGLGLTLCVGLATTFFVSAELVETVEQAALCRACGLFIISATVLAAAATAVMTAQCSR